MTGARSANTMGSNDPIVQFGTKAVPAGGAIAAHNPLRTEPSDDGRDFIVIYDAQPAEVEFVPGHDHALTVLTEGTITIPSDDRIVLDVKDALNRLRANAGGVHVTVEAGPSRIGRAGLTAATIGGLIGLATAASFALLYPDAWNTANVAAATRTRIANLHATGAVVAGALLVAGNIMAAIGRRIQARALKPTRWA